jgi:D-amino peptidase
LKIYVITDMEGSAGILDRRFCGTFLPGNRFEEGRKLVTAEINAAVEGFFEGGATEIVILDGHGLGGIDQEALDFRIRVVQGSSAYYPDERDNDFDAVAWVGQHAKSRTEYAHLAHTDGYNVLEITINGVAVGEFGIGSLLSASHGVRTIFGSGDLAFTKEANELVPGIEAVAVKRGLTPGSGDECNSEEYRVRNYSAVHLHPARACELIKEGTYKAAKRFIEDRESFVLPVMEPPFDIRVKFREEDGNPPCEWVRTHPSSLVEAWKSPWKK